MNSLIAILAQASQTPQGQQAPGWAAFVSSPIFLMLLILVVFYFFMIRSKRQQDQKRQEMLGTLKKGDRVQTIGGILGSVIEAREDEVVVKVDESSNTKIRFARSAIHRVVDSEKPQGK